jgi:hypothetical protein
MATFWERNARDFLTVALLRALAEGHDRILLSRENRSWFKRTSRFQGQVRHHMPEPADYVKEARDILSEFAQPGPTPEPAPVQGLESGDALLHVRSEVTHVAYSACWERSVLTELLIMIPVADERLATAARQALHDLRKRQYLADRGFTAEPAAAQSLTAMA